MSDLAKSVQIVAQAWKESSYYATAERYLDVFWGEGTVFKRLFDRLDLQAVLELACGHGRHAERVAPLAGHLTLMDVHEENIAVCRTRLARFPDVKCHVNNGYDFRPVPDRSLTAIFCYDAMVHFSPDLVESYLHDTVRVLRPGGLALYHHSNYPAPLDRPYGENPHARNHMTQALFREYASAAGLRIVESQVIDWGYDPSLDCVTLLAA